MTVFSSLRKLTGGMLAACLVLTGCASGAANAPATSSPKLTVVATLFPQYDFARHIAGDLADVKLLLKPGTESHSFEPAPEDFLTISKADLFLYTGEVMEPWAQTLLDGVGKNPKQVRDVSTGISLTEQIPPTAVLVQAETVQQSAPVLPLEPLFTNSEAELDCDPFQPGGCPVVTKEVYTGEAVLAEEESFAVSAAPPSSEDEHHDDDHDDHDHEGDVDDHDEHPETDAHQGHDHTVDPHIWTSPALARRMAKNILDAFVEIDAENQSVYTENWNKLDEELASLDEQFRSLGAEHPGETLVFGSPFAAGYFVQEYGLGWASPYANCGENGEPSPQDVAAVVELLKAQTAPVVFYQEPSMDKITDTVSKTAGAEPVLFHTCHNVTQSELDAGATYVSLMAGNYSRLQKALA